MFINDRVGIKYLYRFVEFTLKLLGIELPHERFKLLVFGEYRAESKEEKRVKRFSDSYIYLLNNLKQALDKNIIQKCYYLLNDEMLDMKYITSILEEYYQNYDEETHYLSAKVHLKIIEELGENSIDFAFILSNYILLKNNYNPIIVYEYFASAYFRTIKNKNINKLNMIFIKSEGPSINIKNNNIDKELIIKVIKENKNLLINKYNVKKLYLYGSFSKEKTTVDSDLDLLVIYSKDLINLERKFNDDGIKKILKEKLDVKIDLLDFTHAMDNLDITEMENIITLI